MFDEEYEATLARTADLILIKKLQDRVEQQNDMLTASEEHTRYWEAQAGKYRMTLRSIVNTLGPEPPACTETCDGCRVEMAEALRIAREALGESPRDS